MRFSRSARLRSTAVLWSLLVPLTGCNDSSSDSNGNNDDDSGIDNGSGDGDSSGDGDDQDETPGDGGMDASGDGDGDSDGDGDGEGNDAGMDAAPGDDAGDSSDAAPDAETSEDAGAEDASADAAPVSCDDACPYDVCAGSQCAVTKLGTTSGGGRDLAAIGGGVFWTEDSTVRYCTSASCPAGGAAMTVPYGNHSYAAIAALRVGNTDYVFVTDNQYTQGLWRAETDGDPFLSWGSADNNAAPLAAFGNMVVWGDQGKTYRAAADDDGRTIAMNIGPAVNYAGSYGPTRRSVAVDATNVYASSGSDVYKCPVAETCTASTPSTVATSALPNVVALTIQGSTLYALGGSPFSQTEEEKIWSVPVSGGAPTLLSAQAPGGTTAGHSYVLLADDDALYWNSYNGNIYTCARNDCDEKVLVEGTGTKALAQDASNLYWIGSDGAVYKMAKP